MAAKEKKGKKQKSVLYEQTDGKTKRKNMFCPKCGPGVFMAAHKDRVTCGQCGFTQWTQKKQ